MAVRALSPVVDAVEGFLSFVGELTVLLMDALRRTVLPPFEFRETVTQMAFIGVASVPVVILTGFFSGAVMSLYLSQFLTEYGGSAFVGATLGLAITREIGPVIAGIIVAARGGSAMAAQIGTMAVTEQIDALKMLSVHPTNYLVLPRIYASITMLPILAMVCIWSGMTGGYLVALSEGVPSGTFLNSLAQYVQPSDFLLGMAKAPFFGLIISAVACQQGLRTKEGAVGVGRSTTNTVVISIVLLYIVNFLLAALFFG